MAEKVTIKIQPSGGESAWLTVEDAMQQVLDYIDMLRAADMSEKSEKIIWRLESARTNSPPLEVTAFATGPDPSVSVGYQARQTAERLSRAIVDLENGRSLPDWMEGPVSNIAERFFKRNMNGIGRTDVTINNGPPTTIVHASAKVAALSIEKSRIQTQLEKPDWTRTEYGAIEGEILSTTTLYNKPALIIKERLSGGKISCILSSELAQRVGPKHSWDETWGQRRFAITGALYYDTEGNLKKVDATDLREITPSPVDLEELRSLDIVGGESSEATYLRLWGNG